MIISEEKITEDIVLVPQFIVCDKCKTQYSYMDDSIEIQEFVHIRKIGGYGSVFGDGICYEGDFCQYCVKKLLGSYFNIHDSGYGFENE